jgi:uncharacterized protein with NRDE domain
MCLILLSYNQHPTFRLIVAANRDEFYKRATAPAEFWQDNPNILGGRDLEQMGTWMGMTKTGRFASITNFRDPSFVVKNARSRGELVSNYLSQLDSPLEYVNKIKAESDLYNGFNLLVGDSSTLLYYSNRDNKIIEVSPGTHGLSNHLLDSPWPKVINGKRELENSIEKSLLNRGVVNPNSVLELLANTEQAKTDELPQTGIGVERERVLSPLFIKDVNYGTRSSTVLLIDHSNSVTFVERTFLQSTWQDVSYQFNIKKS